MNGIKLYLVRHGETVGDGTRYSYVDGPPLTENNGFTQAQLATQVLEHLRTG